MTNDRAKVWAVIVVLAALIVAEFVCNRLEAHWRESYRHPDARLEQMGGKR